MRAHWFLCKNIINYFNRMSFLENNFDIINPNILQTFGTHFMISTIEKCEETSTEKARMVRRLQGTRLLVQQSPQTIRNQSGPNLKFSSY